MTGKKIRAIRVIRFFFNIRKIAPPQFANYLLQLPANYWRGNQAFKTAHKSIAILCSKSTENLV